ncbi:MAG: O-antigen ligase family protein [Candidatus Helarchaeota archaeon]
MNFILAIFLASGSIFILLSRGIKKAIFPLIIINVISTFLAITINYYFGKPDKNFLAAVPSYLNLFFLIIVFFNRKYSPKIYKGKFTILIMIYILGFFIFSLIGSASLTTTWRGTLYMIMNISMYFYGILFFENEKDIARFFNIILIFYLLNVFYGLYQQIIGLPKPLLDFQLRNTYLGYNKDVFDPFLNKLYYRISGFSGQLYDYFYILSMLTIMIISAWDFFVSFINKKILTIFIFSYLLLLGLSLERGPIAMLFLLPIAYIKRKDKFIFFVALVIGGIIALSTYSYYLESVGSKRLIRFAQLANPTAENTTLTGRALTHWPAAIKLISENPSGIGAEEGEEFGPHNNYLLIFLQVGWIMGGYFIILIFAIIYYVYNKARRMKNRNYQNLSLGIFAAMVAMLMMGITNIPFDCDCGMFFWLFLALVEKLPIYNDKNRFQYNILLHKYFYK